MPDDCCKSELEKTGQNMQQIIKDQYKHVQIDKFELNALQTFINETADVSLGNLLKLLIQIQHPDIQLTQAIVKPVRIAYKKIGLRFDSIYSELRKHPNKSIIFNALENITRDIYIVKKIYKSTVFDSADFNSNLGTAITNVTNAATALKQLDLQGLMGEKSALPQAS